MTKVVSVKGNISPQILMLPMAYLLVAAVLMLAGCSASNSADSKTSNQNQNSEPTLGNKGFEPHQGYGEARPRSFVFGQYYTQNVKDIKWDSWGGDRATGTGSGFVLGGGQAGGHYEPANIVAFNLGDCYGATAYRAVSVYFPGLGQTFGTRDASPACTQPTPQIKKGGKESKNFRGVLVPTSQEKAPFCGTIKADLTEFQGQNGTWDVGIRDTLNPVYARDFEQRCDVMLKYAQYVFEQQPLLLSGQNYDDGNVTMSDGSLCKQQAETYTYILSCVMVPQGKGEFVALPRSDKPTS